MALPTALFAMIATFALASAALLSSVDVQRGSGRDSGSKNAIAAADAGASVALLRLNRFSSSLSEAHPCVGPAGEWQTPSGGWCPATPPQSVGGSSFSYRTSAYQSVGELNSEVTGEISVVSVGTADGVSRRIEVGLVSYAGEEVFANEKLVGQDNVHIEGNSDIRTDIGTNGNIEKDGDSATICGNLRHGIGGTAPEPDCDGVVTEGNKDLPPVNPPEDISTNNDNCRLEVNQLNKVLSTCANPTEVDTYSKQRKTTVPYNPETRTINIQGGATLTMGGSNYLICKLEINNGELIMAEGEGVDAHIYFDTPENCGIADGEPQVVITGSGKVVSTGYNPSEGQFSLPVLYVIGSPDINTTVVLNGESATNEMVIYAPYSEIEIGGSATLIGLAAGKSLFIHGEPTIKSDPGIKPPDIEYETLWQRTHYVECTGASATPPNANC